MASVVFVLWAFFRVPDMLSELPYPIATYYNLESCHQRIELLKYDYRRITDTKIRFSCEAITGV